MDNILFEANMVKHNVVPARLQHVVSQMFSAAAATEYRFNPLKF